MVYKGLISLLLAFKSRPKHSYPQRQAPNVIDLTPASLSTTFSPEKTKGIKHPTKHNWSWQKSKGALENELKAKRIGSLIVWYTPGERTWNTLIAIQFEILACGVELLSFSEYVFLFRSSKREPKILCDI